MHHFLVYCFKPGMGQLIFFVCPLLATYGPGPGKRQAADNIVACRYTRGLYLRFPISRMTDGRPYDFINLAFKAELLLAGYAIISMDFRGTGKSLSAAQTAAMTCKGHTHAVTRPHPAAMINAPNSPSAVDVTAHNSLNCAYARASAGTSSNRV